MAVFVSGQSLETHHTNQGRDYAGYRDESFASFNHFLSEKDRGALEKIKEESFKNMGYFYVVGNEIVKTILQHDGSESFKKLFMNVRENPEIFLQRYQEICNNDNTFPKINLLA